MAQLPPGSFDNFDPDKLKALRELLSNYNKLTESCFMDCASDFTVRTLKPAEDKCALNCMEKFLKINQRISQRFQEFQMLAYENSLAGAQKLS